MYGHTYSKSMDQTYMLESCTIICLIDLDESLMNRANKLTRVSYAKTKA